MKIIIRIILFLLILTLLGLVLFFFNDVVSSIIPGWNTVVLPQETKLMLVFCFNIALPIYFLLKFNSILSKPLFIGYVVLVNFLYTLSYWLYYRYSNLDNVTINEFYDMLNQLAIIAILSVLIHILFYSYLLLLIKKSTPVSDKSP